jgi:hypothetical protein
MKQSTTTREQIFGIWPFAETGGAVADEGTKHVDSADRNPGIPN